MNGGMTMKLSEAILLGSVNTSQAFGSTFRSDGKTCAWGAALSSVGITKHSVYDQLDTVRLRWPWVTEKHSNCPDCGCSYRVFGLIIHLNDRHRWPRPRIAALVATMEQQEATASINTSSTVIEEVLCEVK